MAKPHPFARAVAYLRTSTEEQELGIAAQRTEVENWSLSYSIPIESWHVDAGLSGTLDPNKRPGLSSMLAKVAAGGVDYLVLAKSDRLARGRALAGFVEYACLKRRTKLIILNQDPDPAAEAQPEQELLAGVLTSFAEYERALIGVRTKAALAARRASGYACGRPSLLTNPLNCDLWYALQLLRKRGVTMGMLMAICIGLEGCPFSNTRSLYRWVAAKDPKHFRPGKIGKIVRRLEAVMLRVKGMKTNEESTP